MRTIFRKIIIGFLLAFFFVMLSFPFVSAQPNTEKLRLALEQFNKLSAKVKNKKYIILIDYDRNIFRKRLWIIDVKQKNKVILSSRVSHAWNSGVLWAHDFSNTPHSSKSSIGAFVTASKYVGKFGESMRIIGLEKKNNNALKRAIVFHSHKWPWSRGCFMTSEKINKKIIELTQNGTFVYVHKSQE